MAYRVSVNPTTKMLVLTFTDTAGAKVKIGTGDFIIWAACREAVRRYQFKTPWPCTTSGGRFDG